MVAVFMLEKEKIGFILFFSVLNPTCKKFDESLGSKSHTREEGGHTSELFPFGRHNYLSSWAIFCPFTSPTAPKIKISTKMKKTPGDIIILHKSTKNHDHRLYCSWDTACDECNCYLSFWVTFCLFTHHPPSHPNSQKNENSKKKKKKKPGDIIILHMCTKTHDHMLYYSWDMVRDRCNCCFSFWAFVFPFTP